mgnify:CR=1 FL=1
MVVSTQDSRTVWLEKLQELKKKKEEELKDIEEKKKKELDEAEQLLKAGIEELTEEEIQILENLKHQIPELKELIEDQKREEEILSQNLEETIQRERISEEAKSATNVNYGEALEQVTREIYTLTDYNVYGDLKDTLQKVQRGEYLSSKEREHFYQRQSEFNSLSTNENVLEEKDSFGYIERSKQVIASINKTLQNSEYKRGADHV